MVNYKLKITKINKKCFINVNHAKSYVFEIVDVRIRFYTWNIKMLGDRKKGKILFYCSTKHCGTV